MSGYPPLVASQLGSLSDAQRAAFDLEFQRRAKKTPLGYVAWLFGLHYAYVGAWGMLAVYWLTAAGLGIWMVADAFRMPGIVSRVNADIATAVLRDVRAVTVSA